jgi:PqqD family protein of HPr-rel-A system
VDTARQRNVVGQTVVVSPPPGCPVQFPGAEGRWQVASGLQWKQFDDSDNWVVYHPGSGDVHLLSSAAYLLWQTIASAPAASFEQLCSALAQSGASQHDELVSGVRSTLDVMDAAGLIEPAID